MPQYRSHGFRMSSLAVPILLFLYLSLHSAHSSPESPHVPTCPSLVEGRQTAPCSWFEGWYVRITDPTHLRSFAVIVGTINATGESMAALLHCSPPPAHSPLLTSAGLQESRALRQEEGGGAPSGEGVFPEPGFCRETQVAQTVFKGAVVTVGQDKLPVTRDPDDRAPPVFEWSAPGVGFVRAKGFHLTELSITVADITLEANLTNQVPWKLGNPAAGPEGWFSDASKILPPALIPPCRWFVHSLGSSASYRLRDRASGQGSREVEVSQGWAHEEKNWGSTFPGGHVWMQGINAGNTAQVVGAALHFSLGGGIVSPEVITFGIRTSSYHIDVRNIDLPGTIITSLSVEPCSGSFKTCAVLLAGSNGHSLRICISATAPRDSFSPMLYVPTAQASWKPSCKESFSATIVIEVWQTRTIFEFLLGTPRRSPNSVETMHGAALEFCGDRVCKT